MPEPKQPDPKKPTFLPRTWKAAPEPEEPAEPPPGTKKSKPDAKGKTKGGDAPGKKRKKSDGAAEVEVAEGTSKLEGTPLLDTYEGRRRVRILVGSVMGVVGLLSLLVLVRWFQPSTPSAEPGADQREAKATIDPRVSAEREAAALVENAKQDDKLGRFTASIARLRKVVRNYEGTEAAKEANAALDRERRNRPLFEVEAAKPPPGPKPPGGVVAAATPAAVPVPVLPAAPKPPEPPKAPEVVARPLPNGYRPESSAPLHPTGWPTRITCERDGAVLVLVPGGEFLMGREDGEPSERPPHRVKLSTYYIDEHEVTNRQYQLYLKESGRLTGEVVKPFDPEKLDLPAVALTAYEARSFCYWANRRLPTEAQWEMAARSEAGLVSYGLTKEVANPRTLEPVMSAPADRSPCGAFDLAGNAWEWTTDYYDSRYYSQARNLLTDPLGPTESRIKPAQLAVKGGSKQGFLTWREGMKVEARLSYLGFRGALSVEATAAPAPAGQPLPPGTNPLGGVIPF